MPVLKNPRHERFAQARASGETAKAAHVLAGFNGHEGNATRMANYPKIIARVAELQARASLMVDVTIASLTVELEEARSKAMETGQISAAVSATMGKAKLHGKLVDRKHVTGTIGTYDLTKVSDEQLDQLEAILGPLADLGGDPSGEAETAR